MNLTREQLTYEVFDDGYDIFIDGRLTYTQHEPFIPYPNKTYAENAEAHIGSILEVANAEPPKTIVDELADLKIQQVESEIDIDLRLSMLELGLV